MIKIYTDGSCIENPGNGGWAAIIFMNNEKIIITGNKKNTTNNQMELQATIQALKYFNKPSTITIFTDSKYVTEGIQSWIINWKKNRWKTSAKKPVKNKELWMELDLQIARHTINWQWVKGHAGNTYNEKADYLARKFIEEKKL